MTTLNKLIQEREQEFMDRYEGANTVQSSISSFMAKDIFKFLSTAIQEGYELGVKDVEGIVTGARLYSKNAYSTHFNDAIDEITDKLQLLLKKEKV